MATKKTKLIVAELKMIARCLENEHFKAIIEEAAQRLEDTDKIARFFRNKTESLGGYYEK